MAGTSGTSRTTCAIVGGGPAGLVLGLLLARAGVRVTVLEKHADFLRDFRGDTVHPTTLAMLDDLGLSERFDALPQTHLTQGAFAGEGRRTVLVDFSRLPLRYPYIAMVPQWDLLNLLAEAARAEPTFTLLTEHEVTGVVREGDRVTGVDYDSPTGPGRLLADLTVACDGRRSTVQQAVGLAAREFPVTFDVWWFRVPTSRPVGQSLAPRLGKGRVVVGIPREGYLQVAYLGRKGTDAKLRDRGIAALRSDVAALLPELADDVAGIASMEDVRHLDVRVDRLKRWHAPGVLCIGDAAHAMSPVGGIGINLAVQDALAAARLLARPLSGGGPRHGVERRLARVQRRRTFPTVATQALQRLLHARVFDPALSGREVAPPRALLALVHRVPALTALPAAVLGVGFRPERVPRWARRMPGRADTAQF
ncbi:FAD-dependent oxidoreductase [Corynebacterium halotolerans]|uniref:FAD-binding domain-containing protein n=1 Tax=Corynebacterium halotolerans YIM 70093 = DSM 44683 TaxID=1121362 RepID=M1P0I5_9CORY|nr:FAD-dependent oxidoreductase [Corynebacterium halotolerans]AGF73295.1 hypothetical protein A605_11485 [Corynebacterium halotolerans YIM 70093 = DSM 44683]